MESRLCAGGMVLIYLSIVYYTNNIEGASKSVYYTNNIEGASKSVYYENNIEGHPNQYTTQII